MTQDEIIEMVRGAGKFKDGVFPEPWIPFFEAFAKLVAAKEREIYDHDTRVLMDALWKACGDDEEVVNATIESQGTLIRGEQA